MQRTNIYLEERQRDALDRLAAEEGTSRAELIRRVLGRWLAGTDSNDQGDLAALEASFGVLREMDAAARQPDDRAAHLDAVWRLRE